MPQYLNKYQRNVIDLLIIYINSHIFYKTSMFLDFLNRKNIKITNNIRHQQ